MKIEMVCCEDTLLNELAGGRAVTRRMVALTYAFAACSSERNTIDWSRVNKAIIDRWSPHALEWIKREAWKLIDAKREKSIDITSNQSTERSTTCSDSF